jgi:hypothetical protein
MELNTLSSSEGGPLGPYGLAKLQHRQNLKMNINNRLSLARLQGNQQLINLLKEELMQLGLTEE